MVEILNNVREKKVPEFNYSEIFGRTIQGEGQYTGVPTIWYRAWGCNFNCNGFGQKDPTNPATWELPFEEIDAQAYNSMEELPVFHTGCDSSYSWAQKFQHLAHKKTAAGICDELEGWLPGGVWYHPKSNQPTHLAFTGGEPMMSQTALVQIMREFEVRGNVPPMITIETNGTQAIRSPFKQAFNEIRGVKELFWSVSPKLYLSGEQWDQAIQPDVIAEYADICNAGQLKYVCNGTDRNWDEVEEATQMYRDMGVDWPVWIMPVGADREMQEEHQAIIAEQAVDRGYNVAARVHTWIFGNIIGK